MKPRSLLLCVLLATRLPAGGGDPAPLLTLVAPSERLSLASDWRVDLVAFNPGTTTCYYDPPGTLVARAGTGSAVLPVEFAAVDPARMTIPPGGFGLRSYVAVRPPSATGLVALEFPEGLPAVLRTAISIDPAAPSPAAPRPAPPARLRHLVLLGTAASAIERSFAGRFGLHESIYFIHGPDAPAAKFQLSFKYRLMRFGTDADGAFTHTLQAGYTQRSLWDIEANSSPFYDTSYMPELIFQSLAPMPSDPARWFTPLGLQFALKHESNGRDGSNSRSLNTAVLRGAFVLGALDRWHLIVAPEVFGYISSLEDNPRLEDYRGFGRLRLVLERNNRRPSIVYNLHAGGDFSHPTHQFDVTIPFRTSLLDVETAVLIQYFNGYGESLLEYEQPSETLRAGISLVR